MSCSEDEAETHTPSPIFNFRASGMLPPSAGPSADKFISWVSVALLLMLFIFFRSTAAPFLNPTGEPRLAVASSMYFNIMAILFIWIVSATTLSILPHFSSHYNEIIAAALFFPMMFATIFALFTGRFLVRMMYYGVIRTRNAKRAAAAALSASSSLVKTRGEAMEGNGSVGLEKSVKEGEGSLRTITKAAGRAKTDPVPKLVAFHRPFRKLVRSSAVLSASMCLLYAHCWSITLSAFKVAKSDGAGAVCRAVFSPLVFGGMAKSLDLECGNQQNGAHEASIWLVWATAVLMMLVIFAQDEFAGKHSKDIYDSIDEDVNDLGALEGRGSYDTSEDRRDPAIDDVFQKLGKKLMPKSWADDRPQDTLEMVPWYSILLVYSAFNILVQLKVFLGRFDARTLQTKAPTSSRTSDADAQDDDSSGIKSLQKQYPGCVFECKPRKTHDGDMWLDFAADTGDGFNSSYQVARMLAQPHLIVRSQNKKRVLPRGSHVVIGGDLAYPDPTPDSYEKRFFRTFEDAMPPPPSFRREEISMRKPALPVNGWKDCFVGGENPPGGESEDILQQYNGPCAFALPGNHDWFDGLSTYCRYILSRDWLGGWLMPQQRSYFALKLTKGWWLLGFDLALSSDIDIDQFKFFANVAAKTMQESDAVIAVTHEPWWVIDEDMNTPVDDLAEKNLRELMDTHLKGKVRVRIAGDLHHYTRYVPLWPRKPGTLPRRRSPLNLSKSIEPKPPPEENKPELIVSGGGGAFLHPTHTFSRKIKVGKSQDTYLRVGCYPDEKVSRRLSWLNIWHFRWRNWRLDVVWAVAYFGVASSLFPLCGIYGNYLEFNPNQSPFALVAWLSINVLALFKQIIVSGRISLLFFIIVSCVLCALTDVKMKQPFRVLWGLAHGFAHMAAALGCLLFVECATEWIIDEGIVKVTSEAAKLSAGPATDLASSLYEEYTTHFLQMFMNVTPVLQGNATLVFQESIHDSLANMSAFQRFHAQAYASLIYFSKWLFNETPLLKATLSIFDLPGAIAQKHTDMCDILCANGAECMLSNEFGRFMLIDRATMVSYSAAIFLYFVVLAIPFAGMVFGTWLALTLNVFKAQYNEGFSSLRIEHWKNFLKLHINTKGDLEIFCIGLRRVPKQWVKDPQWDGGQWLHPKCDHFGGSAYEKDVAPSWAWQKPSKWIPRAESKKFSPEIVDFALISKRRTAPEQHGIDYDIHDNQCTSAPDLTRSSSF